MPLQNIIQFNIIIYSLVAGIILGVLFDFYRVIRGDGNKIILIVQDTLFWILAGVIIFTFLLYINYAFLGPYVYLIMIFSLCAYLRFISRSLFKIENKIYSGISKFIRILGKNIIYPFKLIYFNIIREDIKK